MRSLHPFTKLVPYRDKTVEYLELSDNLFAFALPEGCASRSSRLPLRVRGRCNFINSDNGGTGVKFETSA